MCVKGGADRGRDVGDFGANLCRLDVMADVAQRGDENIGVEIGIGVVDLDDLVDELQSVGAGVVEPPDEGRDVGGAGLGGENRLRGRAAERDVHLDAVVAQIGRASCRERVCQYV